MASYQERIERYLQSHPGASISEARGHGHTPEHPGAGRESERYADYYERRDVAEAHVNFLKENYYGHEAKYDADGAAESTHKIPLSDLEAAMPYNDLEDYIMDHGGWDEVDDGFGYYH